jgi:hypothetical protein
MVTIDDSIQSIFNSSGIAVISFDLSGINIGELMLWLNSEKHATAIIKCHAIISLYRGNSMQDVCAILNITRETVRKWKQTLRQEGMQGLLSEKKSRETLKNHC